MDQLKKRGFSLASKCPFYEKAEEVMEYIFIHCPMIWSLWIALVSVLEIGSVRLDSWLDSSPLKKKGFKTLEGCSPVLVMGDMEEEKQC